MQTLGFIATLAILILGIGLTKYDNNSRQAAQAWKYIDGSAQAISLYIAWQLMQPRQPLASTIGTVLVVLAIAVGYAHHIKMKSADPTWNYLDGANLALWASIALSELSKAVGSK